MDHPEVSLPTGSGNGIDSFVVVDVQPLLRGQPVSGNRPTYEPTAQHIQKKKTKWRRENKEKLTDCIHQKHFKNSTTRKNEVNID